MPDESRTAAVVSVAIWERDGRLLEKFQQDGSAWKSLASGLRLSEKDMMKMGWLFVDWVKP